MLSLASLDGRDRISEFVGDVGGEFAMLAYDWEGVEGGLVDMVEGCDRVMRSDSEGVGFRMIEPADDC